MYNYVKNTFLQPFFSEKTIKTKRLLIYPFFLVDRALGYPK